MRHSFIAPLLLIATLIVPLRASGAPASDGPTSQTLRIVSLAPSATEILFALGAGNQIVGVTKFCQWPAAAKSKPKVGGLYDASIESILVLRPDVIFHLPASGGLLPEFRRRGIEAVELPAEDLDDIRGSILAAGARIGREEAARAIVARLDAQLDDVRLRVSGKPHPSVLMVVGHPPGVLRDVYAAGPRTFLDELIAIAGGANAMRDAPVRYPVVSREALLRGPPEIVIEFKPAGETWSDKERAQLTTLWLDYLGPRAQDRTRVVALDDTHLTIPGPSVGEQAGRLADILHGEP